VPAEELVACAENCAADLTVAGCHGLGAFLGLHSREHIPEGQPSGKMRLSDGCMTISF
jgi:hypothetical protein